MDAQEHRFTDELRQRERQRMDALEREWLKREKEREARHLKREADVRTLEKAAPPLLPHTRTHNRARMALQAAAT